MSKLSSTIDRKFIETIEIDDWEIETDTGFQDISSIHKTIEYEIWEIETEDGLKLSCADTHIVFDENYEEIFIKDLIPYISYIQTKTGPQLVTKVINTHILENMYDITVESDDHRFYSNGILSHNSTTTVAYMLWYVCFNSDKKVYILANKGSTAREILSRLQTAYLEVPYFLQPGAKSFNKGSFELGNGSVVMATTTSNDSIRGQSVNFLYLDEFAHVENADEFYTSTYPTISSGLSTKIMITSTPKGLNLFYKIYKDALDKKSDFNAITVSWSEVPISAEPNAPLRNKAWKKKMIAELGSEQLFNQEFENEFLGSSNTLISGSALRNMVYQMPIFETEEEGAGNPAYKGKLSLFEKAIRTHSYIMIVDVARGKERDYSAFIVIDVSQSPYKIVCKYKSNSVPALLFPEIIHRYSREYDAKILIELNDLGQQVADILYNDFENENILEVTMTERDGQKLNAGLQGNKSNLGVVTSKSVKKIGCSQLKILIESDQLIPTDWDIIYELTTFVRQKNGSYAASDTSFNDDLAMCLVLFGWLTTQSDFKDLTNIDLRNKLKDYYDSKLQADLMPIAFLSNSMKTVKEIYGEDSDCVWTQVSF